MRTRGGRLGWLVRALRVRKRLGPAWLAGLLLAFIACTSAPSRYPGFIPDDLKTVYVFSVMGPATVSRMATRMTGEIVRLLSAQRKVYPVDELPLADGLIEVRIERLFLEPLTRTAAGKIDQARWCCEVEFSFRDTRRKILLLDRSHLTGVRRVQLVSAPVSDLATVSEEIADELSAWIVDWCLSGKPPHYNSLFGYEDLPEREKEGVLIGKPKVNKDINNDGVDDSLQGLTNRPPFGKDRP